MIEENDNDNILFGASKRDWAKSSLEKTWKGHKTFNVRRSD